MITSCCVVFLITTLIMGEKTQKLYHIHILYIKIMNYIKMQPYAKIEKQQKLCIPHAPCGVRHMLWGVHELSDRKAKVQSASLKNKMTQTGCT